MRTMHRITAATLLALLLITGQHAYAAETKVITMSCDGTFLLDTGKQEKREPINKVGVVVNLDEQAVSFDGYRARIMEVDEANINFGGTPTQRIEDIITGDIDRVTGHLIVTLFISTRTKPRDPSMKPDPDDLLMSRYDVFCKVTSRLF
jgi:hypothetical protein